MAWKHIFWNDEFVCTNKDNWADVLAGKIFLDIQFNICSMIGDYENWPVSYRIWDLRLKHIFLEILEFVKEGASDGASGGSNSPRINSMIILNEELPQIVMTMFDDKEKPSLKIPESYDDIQFFGDISHMI